MKDKAPIISSLIVITIFCLFIIPWLSFWIAYFMGWITKLTIGKHLVEGFALIGWNIPLDKIPLFAGCIGWIAGFFVQVKNNNNNNK